MQHAIICSFLEIESKEGYETVEESQAYEAVDENSKNLHDQKMLEITAVGAIRNSESDGCILVSVSLFSITYVCL